MEGFSDTAAADGLDAALTSAGSAHTIHRYPGVGHVRWPYTWDHFGMQDEMSMNIAQILRLYLSICVLLSRLS